MHDSLDQGTLERYLKTKYVGRRAIYLQTTTSTNDVIKKYAGDGEDEGLIVIAEEQTKGRGRMGRMWSTPSGEAIAVSILLRPNTEPSHAPSITPLLAVSVVQAINSTLHINTGIKWPNDIVLDRKKLCGILTEMKMAADESFFIIVGMGLNVNQMIFESEIENIAVSLKRHTGIHYERAQVLASILNAFEKNYEIFKKRGIAPFADIMRSSSVLLGKRVEVHGMGETYNALALDIDPEGALLVRKDDGKLIKIASGEVTIKGYYGYE